MSMSYRKKTNKAFTLSEVILTVAILGLISAAIVPFIRSVSSTWNIGSRKTEVQQNARSSMDIMLRMLRQARRITQIPPSGSGDFVKFRDADELYTIVFYHNVASSPFYIGNSGLIREGDLVMRSISDSGSSDALLARNLENLQINFKDKKGLIISRPQAVASLNISMVLKDSSNNEKIDLVSAVFLRCDARITKPVWVTAGNSVYELLSGKVVSGLKGPQGVSVNQDTGECWIADTGNNRVKKISPQGNLVLDIPGFNKPFSVSVSQTTGECWVADTENNRVKKLSADGSTIFNISGFNKPMGVAVNPYLGGCWVADTSDNSVKRIALFGFIFSDIPGFKKPNAVSLNASDGSCWVADTGNNSIKKISLLGIQTLGLSGFKKPEAKSVNYKTQECWVADTGNNRVKKISKGGQTIFTAEGFNSPGSIWVDSVDDFCWVADTGNKQLVRLNTSGEEELRIDLSDNPVAVAGFENE